MNKKLFSTLFAQDFTLKGIVKNSKTKRALKDVNVTIPRLNKGCVSDSRGHFAFKLPQGKYKMVLTSVGYETKEITVSTQNTNGIMQVYLKESVTNLGEVSVTGTQTKKTAVMPTTTKLNVDLKDIPMTVSSVDKEIIANC